MKPRTLIILVGLPASGKSTFRAMLEAWYREESVSHHVISSDDFIEAEAAKLGKTYDQVYRDLAEEGRKHCNTQMSLAMAFGRKVIIWDQTNLAPKKRAAIASRVSRRLYNVGCVYFEVDDEAEHQRRLASRPGKFIRPEVIEDMKASYVRPTLEEGFDFVRSGEEFAKLMAATQRGQQIDTGEKV